MTEAAEPQPPEQEPDREAGTEGELESEDERAAADELNAASALGPQFAGGSVFNGPVNVWGDMRVAGGDRDREARPPITSTRIVDEFARAPQRLVEPPHFAELVRLVEREHLVLLTGSGCGNRTAAAAALRAARRAPLLELPANLPTARLIDGVEQVCAKHPKAGILIASVDADALGGFAGFDLRRLRGALQQGAALVLTTRADEHELQAHELPVLAGAPPDAAEIVRRRGLPAAAREHALQALSLLPAPVAPKTAVAVARAAAGGRHDTPQAIAHAVSGQSEELDEWLRERPTAERVASLAAAATLDGVPSADVDAEASRLKLLLEGEVEPSSEPKRFGAANQGWPAGVIAHVRRTIPTYFGRQEVEVVEICPPNRRDHLVAFLWKHLGVEFRVPYLEWLRSLAGHDSERVRSGAAVTAGLLFVKEPATAERELLRAWALDDRLAPRACAGLALGVPVLFGADPAPARALATKWARDDNVRLRRTAVIAFGGPLGAWDPGAAAPAHLWRIAAEMPALRQLADASLASLTAAGGKASWARATVLSLLEDQAEQRPAPARAYELLPLVMRRLTRRDEVARESLAALLDDGERESLTTLTALLARAFDAPIGYDSAHAAIRVLLNALAANRIDRDVVNRLIRETKAAAPPGRLSALGTQLERVLNAEARGDGPPSRAARAVHATFYSSHEEAL